MGTSYGPPRVVGVGVGGGPAWANGRRRANVGQRGHQRFRTRVGA